ncbi:MAG TPA: hypothetical protein VG455_08480 [Acidimicrobiales bacterium]|nr:hypothetical protein [Acidimicrobiales bacterium]
MALSGRQGDVAAPGGAGGTASEATVLRTVQSLGTVIGPTALITALLFYFGWAKAQAFSQFFGLDVSLFGFSTQDYLLQSIRSVFIPLGEVLLAGLLLLWAHGLVSSQIDRRPEWALWPWVAGAMVVVGVASFMTGLVLNASRYPSDAVLLLTPLSLLLGTGLVSYAVLIDRRRRRTPHRAGDGPRGQPHLPGLSVILVSTLLAVGLVWVVANYAELKGREEGEFFLDQLEFQPGVVVFSARRLHIEAPGVEETGFAEPDSAYAFRYRGLKLLFHSGGRYFLVPESWSLSGGRTIVLHDDDSVRLEFVRSG